MALTKLGLYIEQLDTRNTDNSYGKDSVVGISTQKQMIRTKADLSGVNLTSYKLMGPDSFAYVPDTSRRGDKVSLAFNSTEETYLISSISVVFRVKEGCGLLSDYLFMYFTRPEFDRYARFNSWGSARETFSWEDMCDIDIELPSVEIQQKYVNIYNAVLSNQRSYEKGLEDLKRSVFAEIDIVKHSAPKASVGELLEEIDVRNTDGAITNVQGINIKKEFMPSVADISSVSLRNYKVVRTNQFAYSSMQTGRDKCIRIALYDKSEPILISPAYSVLQVKDSSVVAEYIMLWFSRPETDRYGWFASDASVRANLDLDRFFEIQIPLPDLKKQHSIADIYIAYMLRREINEQLKAQIKDICSILISGALAEGEDRNAVF